MPTTTNADLPISTSPMVPGGSSLGAYGIAVCFFRGSFLIGLGEGTDTVLRYRKLRHVA